MARGGRVLRLADFCGTWRLARRIEDARTGGTGLFDGRATFVAADADACVLHYHEQGVLRLQGQPPLQAERGYRWQASGDGVEVCFSDGRPFHSFGFDAVEASHWCDPDRYRVRYDFAGWPVWAAEWMVSGPRKSYVMRSRYVRLIPDT